MDNQDGKKALEALADAAEHEAKEHAGDGCLVEATAGLVGCIARSAANALATTNGPAQVATPEYRMSWDRTFGGKAAVVGAA